MFHLVKILISANPHRSSGSLVAQVAQLGSSGAPTPKVMAY